MRIGSHQKQSRRCHEMFKDKFNWAYFKKCKAFCTLISLKINNFSWLREGNNFTDVAHKYGEPSTMGYEKHEIPSQKHTKVVPESQPPPHTQFEYTCLWLWFYSNLFYKFCINFVECEQTISPVTLWNSIAISRSNLNDNFTTLLTHQQQLWKSLERHLIGIKVQKHYCITRLLTLTCSTVPLSARSWHWIKSICLDIISFYQTQLLIYISP